MIEIPDLTYSSRIADWIELFALVYNKPISKNKIISLLGSEVDESNVDSAIQELTRRLNLYGIIKPYKVVKNTVSPLFAKTKFPEHTMCLLFSTYGAADAGHGTKLFERLTQTCIDHFLATNSILFGAPAGVSFKTQVDNLAASCFEGRGDDPSRFDKDRGVDIVAWKPFSDQRNSHIHILIQCAAGGKWRDKKPIPLTSWRRYISWNTNTTIPGLALTQIIDPDKWKNAVDDYGVIIDRARLFRIISSKGYKRDAQLNKDILKWNKANIT